MYVQYVRAICTYNRLLCYGSTCSLYVDALQASVVGGEAGMAKDAPFLSTRIIVRIIPRSIWNFVIWASTTATAA